MFGRERQQPVRDGRRERRAGRVVQRRVGDVQARPMLGEHLLEAREIGAVRRVRDADDPRTVRAQQRLEVEVARIVEHDRVTRLQQQPADEIERVRAAVGQHDLRGFSLDAVLREPPGELLAHRGQAERCRIVGQRIGFVARRGAQRAAQALVSHDGGSHPQPGFTDVGAASSDWRDSHSGSARDRAAGRDRRARAAAHAPTHRSPSRAARPARLRSRAARTRRRRSISTRPARPPSSGSTARARRHQRAARDACTQRIHHGFHTRARRGRWNGKRGGLAHGKE